MADKLTRRLGWFTRAHPLMLDDGRMLVGLYSDGFSFSLVGITDDLGKTWRYSEPLVGGGNIQPSFARKADGTLVAYMRDNGPPPQRLQVSSSTDKGLTWSPVRDSQLPNPGSGADATTLRNGHWALVYNDTERGRHSLAVSISTDEGQTWPHTRHIERDPPDTPTPPRHGYPAIIQGRDDVLHVVYSYQGRDAEGKTSKTIRYARFSGSWVCEK